jgi:hypothetical protein
MAYDKHMNIVLGDAVEYRKIIPKGKTKREERDGKMREFSGEGMYLILFDFRQLNEFWDSLCCVENVLFRYLSKALPCM